MINFAIKNKKNEQALKTLHAKYSDVLFYIAYEILEDEILSEKAVIDTYTRLISSDMPFDDEHDYKPCGILIIICRNIAKALKEGDSFEEYDFDNDDELCQPLSPEEDAEFEAMLEPV